MSGTGELTYGAFGKIVCDVYLTSITTGSGYLLVIHESAGVSMNTTCEGVTVSGMASYAHGSSMDCNHDFFINNVYASGQGYDGGEPTLWSITYSFRDVTVV
jgi:hypothetical protein